MNTCVAPDHRPKPLMRPIAFDGCFGWLHADPLQSAGDTAVVLCGGLKGDGLAGHRPFRQLAGALAAAGYPTVRFDYPGTGDSVDISGGEHLSVWQQSIHDAADWVRANCGARRVVLCGLRFGATLAATIAMDRDDVAALVLLAPVLRGRSYVRQLTIEANLRRESLPSDDGLAVHELHLSGRTIGLISQVELRRVLLPSGCKLAVYAPPSPLLSECVAAWRGRGTTVTCADFTPLAAMLRPTFMCHEGPVDVAPIVDWLCATHPPLPAPGRRGMPPARVATELRPPLCRETPLRFGADGELFGILCRPADGGEGDQVVLIVNGGGDPHQGFARRSVDLARRLAAAGIASLRMDFAGLGDSAAPDDEPVHVFETDRRADIAAAIDSLSHRGYRRFAVHGVCSGAYHAFHAALDDSRIGVLLLVNLPMFQWQPGAAIEFVNHVVQGPGYLLRRLARRDLWVAALRGKLDIRRRLRRALSGTGIGRMLAAVLGSPERRFARDSMRRLAPRTKTLFLVAEGDAAVETLVDAFGANRTPQGAKILIASGLDHALSGSDMQRKAADRMIAFLRYHAAPATRLDDAVRRENPSPSTTQPNPRRAEGLKQ